ncbi:MAG: hybrid sensor histidine kinase/response regulator [Pseudomonadota bacterium]
MMPEQNMLEPVCQIVADSRESVAYAVASQDAPTIAMICRACADNIQSAAEMAGLPELQDNAVTVSSDLAGLDEHDPDWVSTVGTKILDWSDAVLTYLEHPDESARLENLASSRFRVNGAAHHAPPEAHAVTTEISSAPVAAERPEKAPVPASPTDELALLLDLIAAARSVILDEADKLTVAEIQHRDYPQALNICLEQIDGIATLLEANGWDALAALCAMVRGHFSSLAEGPGFTEEDCYKLVIWMEDLAAYLNAPHDAAAANRVLAILPEQHAEGLADWLVAARAEHEAAHESPPTAAATEDLSGAPAPATPSLGFIDEEPAARGDASDELAVAADITAAFPQEEFSEDGEHQPVEHTALTHDTLWEEEESAAPASSVSLAEVPQAEGVLGILQEELAEVSGELSTLAAVITAPDADMAAVMEATAHYSEIVERIVTASESLGMSGLRDVCNFVNQNISVIATSDADVRCQAGEILAQWPLLVLSYLSAPTDEQLCLSVITHLQSTQWPEPLDDQGARHLLEALATEIIEPELGGEGGEARPTVAGADDVALELAPDVNQDLLNAFFHESPTHAATLSDCITRIGRHEDVLDSVAKAQRIAHTLKGSANLIGARGVANLTHHMEDIFEFINTRHTEVPAALNETLQEAADCVETMIEALQGLDAPPPDAQRILQDVLDWANRIDTGNLEEIPQQPPTAAAEPEKRAPAAQPDENKTPPNTQAAASGGDVLRVPTRTVNEMFRMVGEMSIAIVQMQEHLKRVSRQAEDLRLQDDVLQKHRFELEDAVDVRNLSNAQRRMRVVGDDANFDSLEMDHYDEVYGAAHAFIETVVDYREMMLHMHDEVSDLDGLFHQQQRLNKELQRVVMSTRLVPVNTISSRLQRAVRQAGRATGKQVDLEIIGEEMLIDGDVLNNLADPIMHMLRNSVDHGIEEPEVRRAAGKPENGRIVLTFAQHGNTLLVRCEDDGKGLDYQRIHATAIKRGLVGKEEILDEHAMARLILMPGFSTREQATQISGRGVGMDVVNTTIRALNGSMDIGNRERGGCRVSLRLPITLVTSHTVLVRVGRELFAVPTNTLSQILAPGTGEFQTIGREITYHLAGDVHPAMTLAAMVGVDDAEAHTIDATKTVLLVRVDNGLVAVVVDYVIGAFDLVIKGTGSYVRSVRGVSGVSILGDGSVVSVLNVPDLIQSATSGATVSTAHHGSNIVPLTAPSAARLLIVDDSLSVRKSLSQLMADAGYAVCVARDGLEAIEVLHKENIALVLTDLEMPRMTGLELTAHIRGHQQLQQLPVIMITSRSMQKHRDHAQRVGVNAYVNKPFSEDDLLATVESLLNGAQGGGHGG